MYKNKTVGIVIPAFNEQLLICRVLDTIPDFVDKVVVVDDCSRDNTSLLVSHYAENQPDRVYLIHHHSNQGVGGAVATGYTWCRDHSMDIAVVMAGDAQMDPTDLPSILEPLADGSVDYTKGNRLFTGEAWKIIPKWRYLGNAALSLMTKIASGYWNVADSQSGYTGINQNALKTIQWDQMYKRYGQPNDLLVRLNVYNFRVKDVPIQPVYHIGEKSGIQFPGIIPRISFLLLKLFVWRMFQKYVIRDFHPLIFFYTFAGFLLGLIGPILSVRLIYFWILMGSVPPINALALMLCIITGVQFLLFAMWFDMEYNRFPCK